MCMRIDFDTTKLLHTRVLLSCPTLGTRVIRYHYRGCPWKSSVGWSSDSQFSAELCALCTSLATTFLFPFSSRCPATTGANERHWQRKWTRRATSMASSTKHRKRRPAARQFTARRKRQEDVKRSATWIDNDKWQFHLSRTASATVDTTLTLGATPLQPVRAWHGLLCTHIEHPSLTLTTCGI